MSEEKEKVESQWIVMQTAKIFLTVKGVPAVFECPSQSNTAEIKLFAEALKKAAENLEKNNDEEKDSQPEEK